MKRILMLMFVAVMAVSSVKAITVDEAYVKLTEIKGATLSEVPNVDCAKQGLDWGKIAMFIGASSDTLKSAESVLSEITDPVVLDQDVQGKNHALGYAAKQKDGRTRALIGVTMPGVGIIVVYAQGGDDIVSDINID